MPPCSSPRPFEIAAAPVGASCNLACRYCHYSDKVSTLYPARPEPRINDETLERFIREHLAAQPAGSETVFHWHGGEPTLFGLDGFRRIVAWQQAHAAGRAVRNTLQTNGTLLDDAWGAFLHAQHFSVGLSLDGPRAMHDAFRLDRGGAPTWEKTMAGLRVLRRHRVDLHALVVIHRRNCRHPREVYDFLTSSGLRHLRLIPLVERRATPPEVARGLAHAAPGDPLRPAVPSAGSEFFASAQSLPPGRYGQFLRTLFDHWSRRDVGRVVVEQFESALAAWLGGEPSDCAHTRRCRRAFALEHDGELYGCDHYVYPGFSLGNLSRAPLARLVENGAADRFAAAKEDLPARCRACPVRFACNGDCPKHRFVRAAEGEAPVSYLCGDFGRFFRHIDPVMRELAALVRAGRPPSEIMRRPLQAPPSGFN